MSGSENSVNVVQNQDTPGQVSQGPTGTAIANPHMQPQNGEFGASKVCLMSVFNNLCLSFMQGNYLLTARFHKGHQALQPQINIRSLKIVNFVPKSCSISVLNSTLSFFHAVQLFAFGQVPQGPPGTAITNPHTQPQSGKFCPPILFDSSFQLTFVFHSCRSNVCLWPGSTRHCSPKSTYAASKW